jgi:hypothetical protein
MTSLKRGITNLEFLNYISNKQISGKISMKEIILKLIQISFIILMIVLPVFLR